MTCAPLVLWLLSQAAGAASPLAEAESPPLPASSMGGWRYLTRVRWRFGDKLYALAEGGTLLFPEEDGTLRLGAYASLGLGVDNAR
ncbi:MAG TPA: hypothetical protein VEU33_48025 [Archangium sp.]|nr:hypothetical protein [Archangium sp.]